MQELKKLLTLKDERNGLGLTIILVLVAYIFAVGVRLIWVDSFSTVESATWNDQIMINTNDGYFWAEGARDILAGSHQEYDLSPVNTATAKLTAFFASIFPFSFESVILYMPGLLGSLLVVPLVLIGRALNQTTLGFIGALIASIAWSYYNRTMIGYYDTDMLIIVLPVFVLWSLILGITHNQNRYLLITTATVILYNTWYPGSYSLNFAMAGMLLGYTLIFDRKNLFNYKQLLFLTIVIASLPLWVQVGLSIGLFLVFHFLKERADKGVIPLLLAGVVLVAVTAGFGPILNQLSNYIFRVETDTSTKLSLHFFNVVQTVREAGDIPFEIFANRISGHPVTFVLSVIGYILMVIRYPVMLLALPLIGLGFLAYSGGLRFTVYAVPVNALGIAFLILLFAKFVKSFVEEKKQKIVAIAVSVLLTGTILYPHIQHAIDYKVPTVFNKDEVQVLDQLKHKASREDYVLAWWDYGYPIRYYSDVKTLVDGGKHSGQVNFPVSYSLTYAQAESANMARLVTEYTERQYNSKSRKNQIIAMMDDYGYQDPNLFFEALRSKTFSLPEKTREVFFYLPYRMLDIYNTVRLFSNLDLNTGSQYAQPFLFSSIGFKETGEKILLGKGVEIDKKTNTVLIGNRSIQINTLYMTQYDPSGYLRVQKQLFNMMAPVSVIFMKNYNKFLVVDQQTLNSTYFQLFVLEQYDPELFEPVIMSPIAKVYRLKK